MTAVQQALDVSVGAFVDELGRAGIRHVCVCPGSRSTPLAIKLAQADNIKLWMHLDERSAAFFALGLAKTLRAPVALLATSGTAAANFLPAVVEARLARVPLVVLTADRPHELRDVGAPQTIDQLRLYGEHVKWFFDLPEPELSAEHVRLVRTLAGRAVGSAVAEPAGPVHLNWPFREPLVPLPVDSDSPAMWGARADRGPYVAVETGRLVPSPELVERLAAELAAAPRGLIVCGPQDDPELPRAVVALAQATGYPVLADALSGVRTGPHDRSLVIDAYDAFLRDDPTTAVLLPQVVMRVGAPPTSKPLQQLLERAARQIVVDPGGWREPSGLASAVLHVDPRLLCTALATVVPARGPGEWHATWRRINAVARQAIERHLNSETDLSEPKVIAELQPLLPANAVVYAGNSMPVRDLDTFLRTDAAPIRCLSNRGANGIDGVISSALGASAAGARPVVLLIGDVSFYHDLNGLLAARQHHLDLLVVLINNDGGGIFSFLSQAETASVGEHFELLFGTPHGLDFRPFVEGYGGHFARADDWPMFLTAINDGLHQPGLRVIEVQTQRARNVAQHRAIWQTVAAALAPAAVG
ncbi:MAG TPA: 2-succinyl-5-enolpyruvyl-6-hydroxy-3-cyclohexene-1-carboxylic-acid synthase [Chloroflexota bacterium]|nr:2-succinyl-5-enolpyruvyl-6-hydroxy-3-cyclohexene-1-carboxylic-acid synthase [Chloroflexota bacterium]